jgi:hypothetical protein
MSTMLLTSSKDGKNWYVAKVAMLKKKTLGKSLDIFQFIYVFYQFLSYVLILFCRPWIVIASSNLHC